MECDPKEPVLFDTDDEGNEVYINAHWECNSEIPDGIVYCDDENGKFGKHCIDRFVEIVYKMAQKDPYGLAADLGLEYRKCNE